MNIPRSLFYTLLSIVLCRVCSALPKKAALNPILEYGYFSDSPVSGPNENISRRDTKQPSNSATTIAVAYDSEHESARYLNVDKSTFERIRTTGATKGSTKTHGLIKRLIIGADNRVEVCDTTSFPMSVIGFIICKDSRNPNIGHTCTGTLIGPRTILTSAHCIHMGSGGKDGFYKNCIFQQFIHSTCTSDVTTMTWATTTGWVFAPFANNGDVFSDMAVIQLATKDTGRGHMAIGFDENLAVGSWVNMNGYPADLNGPIDEPAHLFHADGQITYVNDQYLDFDADVNKGQSGSAVYLYYDSGERVIYGAVRGHWTNLPTPTSNFGVRINKEKFATICAWLDSAGTHLTGCP